jgi:organic radical activating enzyme
MAQQVPEDGTLLPLMEEFYTIQGEGFHTGKAAYFIRLGGCDVECVWCDVKESWDANKHPLLTVSDLLEKVKESPAKLVVITGGEPAMHDLTALTNVLKENGYELAIETSGAHTITGEWDWICISPKKFKAPLTENIQYADELKVVIYHPSDFEWAEKYKTMVSDNCICLLQPEYSKHTKAVELIVDYVKNNPAWRISLQTHKVINVP